MRGLWVFREGVAMIGSDNLTNFLSDVFFVIVSFFWDSGSESSPEEITVTICIFAFLLTEGFFWDSGSLDL